MSNDFLIKELLDSAKHQNNDLGNTHLAVQFLIEAIELIIPEYPVEGEGE